MISVYSGVVADNFSKLLQPMTDHFPCRMVIAHVVQCYFKSNISEAQDELQVLRILEAASAVPPIANASQWPYRLRRSHTKSRKQIIYGADVFDRAQVRVVVNRKCEPLIIGKPVHCPYFQRGGVEGLAQSTS
jgi:hypothetical protein